MSSFDQTLNSKNQFIVAIKVIKCPTEKQYKSGIAKKLMRDTESKRALIDTGASHTCIPQEFADELKLIPIGQSSVVTASDDCIVNQYKVDFAIPVADIVPQLVEKDGKISVNKTMIGEKYWVHIQHNINSIPSIDRDRGFDFILGMDILSKMHITMFNKQIIISF